MSMNRILNPQIPEDKEKLRRLFRIKRIEGEMLSQRGYTLEDVYLLKNMIPYTRINLSGLQNPRFTYDLFLQAGFNSRESLNSLYYNPNNNQDIVVVIYLNSDPKSNEKDRYFQDAKNLINTQTYRHFIFIREIGLTDNVNTYIRNSIGYKIEVFLDQDLALNPTKHALAPIKITHIPSGQTQQWAQQEGIDQKEKLPIILNVDKIARWYAGSSGDIFQFVIMGATTDTAGFYRLTRTAPQGKKND